jgi:hypothetical protein
MHSLFFMKIEIPRLVSHASQLILIADNVELREETSKSDEIAAHAPCRYSE